MSTKHSKGPWIAKERWIIDADGHTVCCVSQLKQKNLIDDGKEHIKACVNAKLMAAAPEMLELLIRLDSEVRNSGLAVLAADIRELLKKIEG